MRAVDFYPRSPCGERRKYPVILGNVAVISIHALLAESDAALEDAESEPQNISIHALLAESDTRKIRIFDNILYFYPRSPCGERRYFRFSRLDSFRISIHALLAESDERNPNKRGQIQISIHALLAESDLAPEQNATQQRNFYPRSPCGERRALACSAGFAFLFLSTLSLRRATARRESRQQPAGISIHALLAESDPVNNGIALQHTKFLSTLSLRRATTFHQRSCIIKHNFYPRSPCGERPIGP